MTKRRESRKGKFETGECNLDGEYISPIHSMKDMTIKNIISVISNSRYAQSLIILTIIGFILRFYNLGFNSLWLDEAATHSFAIMSIPDIWKATAGGEFNPPLFYWIEHLMLMIGNNEVILRFIPTLLGVLTIPIIYFVGKEFMDRNVGIIAAAAIAVSPFLIFYSQEARAYSMMLFFVALSMIFYFKSLKTHDLKNWTLFSIFSALALWSHFYAFIIILSLFLYAIILQIKDIRKNLQRLKMIATSIIIFIILCLPLILVAAQLFISRTSSAPAFGMQGMSLVSETFKQLSGFYEIPTMILLIIFAIGIIQTFFVDKHKGIFLILVTIITFTVSVILSYKMPMVPRYLIFFNTIFFIGIAISYKLFYNLVNRREIIYLFIAFLIVLSTPMLTNYYSSYSKEDWRGFSGQLQQLTNPGDIVVTSPGYISLPLNYYYSNSSDLTFRYEANNITELDKINSGKLNNTIYYIVTGDINAINPEGTMIAWLNEHTKPIGQRSGIYLYGSR